MSKKFRSDLERLEIVKKYKCSGISISEFGRINNIPYATLRDWIYAFDNLDGDFVRINKAINNESGNGVIIDDEDVKMKMLSTDEIYKKSSHFSRFDHSVVVIEYEKIKVTTSIEQAIKILEKYYDRF